MTMPRSAATSLAAGAVLLVALTAGACTGQTTSGVSAPVSASPKTATPSADTTFEDQVLTQDSNTVWRQAQVAVASQPAENRESTARPGAYTLSAACEGKGQITLTLSDGQQSQTHTLTCGTPTQIINATLDAPAPKYIDALEKPATGSTATMVWRLDRSTGS